MRILHISTGETLRGGEQQVLFLMQGLRARGHAQHLLAPAGSTLALQAETSHLTVSEIRPRHLGFLYGVPAIQKHMRSFHPDLLHLHDARAHGLGQLANRKSLLPCAVSRRVAFPMPTHIFSRRKFSFPRQRFLAVSYYVKQRLMEAGIHEDLIDVVYDCVDVSAPAAVCDRQNQRASMGLGPEDFVVGYAGALEAEKGMGLLLKAVTAARREVRNLQCVIAGAGSLRSWIEREMVASALEETFHLLPFPESPSDWMSSLDLFVLPSRMEGLGSILLLAMHCGVPVLASNAGGIPEIVSAGETGFLFETNNVAALTQVLTKLAGQPDLLRSVIEAARLRVQKDFSLKTMTESTLGSYQKLISTQ